MTREMALIKALEIVEICRTYGHENRCRQCPFNVGNRCIVNDGTNSIPINWWATEIIEGAERSVKK